MSDQSKGSPVVGTKINYLTGEYPRATDTFIQREVAALRELGFRIETMSIRRTASHHHVGQGQREEAERTFYVLTAAKNPFYLIGAHAGVLLRAPRRWFAALALAWRTRPPGLKAMVWQLFYFFEAAVVARRLRETGATHLHNHFGDSSCSVAMLASVMSGLPYSFTLHGPAIFFEPYKWRLDAKIEGATFVACISHFARSQGMFFSDQRQWAKLKIVHCGINPSAYLRPNRPRARHVLFVGRLAAVKGVPLLLRAFAPLVAQFTDSRLRIVGDGPDRLALEIEAKELGIAEYVDFLGYKPEEEVAEELAHADMLVLPSFAEGVPVVLMEAMAASLPVIASRVAGVPELVEDGVSGFLIPPGDLDSLSARLEQLLSDANLCERMGKAGRAKVVAEFDVTKEAQKLSALIRRGRVDDPA